MVKQFISSLLEPRLLYVELKHIIHSLTHDQDSITSARQMIDWNRVQLWLIYGNKFLIDDRTPFIQDLDRG